MTRKPNQRKTVRMLRRQGLSYREIEKKVNVAKSTISVWCKDILLNFEQKARLDANWKQAGYRGSRIIAERRAEEIRVIKEQAKQEIHSLTPREFQIAGTIIYWAEGSKTSNTSITNCDPNLILFMTRWFEKVCNIPSNRLRAHLHYHEAQDEEKIKKYWSQLTGIPLENFGKSFLKPKGTGHRKNILPNGIIRIRVAGIGADNLRHKIMGWIEGITACPASSIGSSKTLLRSRL